MKPYTYVINPSGVRVEVRSERVPLLKQQGFRVAEDQSPPGAAPGDDNDLVELSEDSPAGPPSSVEGTPVESPPGAPPLVDFNDRDAFPNKGALVDYGATVGLELDMSMTRGDMIDALNEAVAEASADEQ